MTLYKNYPVRYSAPSVVLTDMQYLISIPLDEFTYKELCVQNLAQ
jgi:hypothetical protein